MDFLGPRCAKCMDDLPTLSEKWPHDPGEMANGKYFLPAPSKGCQMVAFNGCQFTSPSLRAGKRIHQGRETGRGLFPGFPGQITVTSAAHP